MQIYLEFRHSAGFCTWKKTGEPGERPSEQRDQQPPTRDHVCEKRTRGYQRWEARASTSHVFCQKHTIWHTAIFVNIFQWSQAVSCDAGLVINFVFLKYYFYLITWKTKTISYRVTHNRPSQRTLFHQPTFTELNRLACLAVQSLS